MYGPLGCIGHIRGPVVPHHGGLGWVGGSTGGMRAQQRGPLFEGPY